MIIKEVIKIVFLIKREFWGTNIILGYSNNIVFKEGFIDIEVAKVVKMIFDSIEKA